MTAKELRNKFEDDLLEMQEICMHAHYSWMEYHWAPGHGSGIVRICDNCEKELERKP